MNKGRMIGKAYHVPLHQPVCNSAERKRARSEAQQQRRAREAEALAGVQLILDAGYVTAQFKKGHKLIARNLVSITLTDEGKRILCGVRGGKAAIKTLEYGFTKGLHTWSETLSKLS
jgi:hypothetical protein